VEPEQLDVRATQQHVDLELLGAKFGAERRVRGARRLRVERLALPQADPEPAL
jgi:hypothetical protein